MRPYCLRCFATLPAGKAVCPACGATTRPRDRLRWWSRHPRHVQNERAAKVAISILVLATVALSFLALRSGTGPAAGFVAVLPIVLGAALWDTASKITRHRPGFRPVLVWSLVCVLLAAVAAVVGTWIPAALALVLALLVLWVGHRAERWRRDLMAGLRRP